MLAPAYSRGPDPQVSPLVRSVLLSHELVQAPLKSFESHVALRADRSPPLSRARRSWPQAGDEGRALLGVVRRAAGRGARADVRRDLPEAQGRLRRRDGVVHADAHRPRVGGVPLRARRRGSGPSTACWGGAPTHPPPRCPPPLRSPTRLSASARPRRPRSGTSPPASRRRSRWERSSCVPTRSTSRSS